MRCGGLERLGHPAEVGGEPGRALGRPGSPPGAVVFATAPIPFAVAWPPPGVDLGAADRRRRVAPWLKADDAQAPHDKLAAAGVRIVTAPADGPFGWQFAFADPEGYLITVHDLA